LEIFPLKAQIDPVADGVLESQYRFCIVYTASQVLSIHKSLHSMQCTEQTVMLFACRQQAVAPVAKVVKLASRDHASGSGLEKKKKKKKHVWSGEEEEERLSSFCCTSWMTDGWGTNADQGSKRCHLAAVLLPLQPE